LTVNGNANLGTVRDQYLAEVTPIPAISGSGVDATVQNVLFMRGFAAGCAPALGNSRPLATAKSRVGIQLQSVLVESSGAGMLSAFA